MRGRKRVRTLALVAAVLLAALTLIGSTTSADTTPPQSQSQAVVEALAAPSVSLSYQGRLLDLEGNPKSDGDYLMSFSLYNVATLGSPLWTETKNISLGGGLFSTLLGDSTALDLTIFNGQVLWLGVTVVGDPETSPRMPVTYVPYAVYAGNANTLGGQPRDAYAAAVHNHDASNIVSGNLPLERYHAADNLSAEGYLGNAAGDIALNNGVKQVNLVADMLDGQHNTDFAPSIHNHDATYVNVTGDSMSGQLSVGPTARNAIVGESSDLATTYAGVLGNSTGRGYGVKGSSTENYGGFFYSTNKAGLMADTKTPGGPDLVLGGSDGDGQLSVEPASGANLTLSSESDVKVRLDKDNNGNGVFRIQNSAGGDVVTADEAGVVSATKVSYAPARSHYLSILGEAFSPWTDVAYGNSGGCGGAYVAATGCHALVAPVQLPDGATVNQFTVFFYDASANDMTVSLQRQYYTGCGYTSLASVNSTGNAGYYSLSDPASAVVDNTTGGYYVKAYSCNWDSSSLMIKGAVIRYTVSEAP